MSSINSNNSKKLPEWLIDNLSDEIDTENAEFIPQRFEDSTHDLWRLESKKGNHFLKVCSNTSSPFWQVMQQLFGVDLQHDIQHFSKLYSHIAVLTSVRIPELILAQKINSKGSYILTSEVEGTVPDNSNISRRMVEQLAKHLANFHQDQHKNWGSIHNPLFDQNDWGERLTNSLQKSAQKWGCDKQNHTLYLENALEACHLIKTQYFVPLMPDLRWDQFLVSNENISLLDLDAFVLAPRELDFVLLEYLLDEQQIEHFKAIYTQHNSILDIDSVRPAYRLLLFYMQVLGEPDIDRWMNKTPVF